MAVTIRTLNTETRLENGLWSCSDDQIARLLNRSTSIRPFAGYEPSRNVAVARYIIDRFGGEILRVEGETSTVLPGVAY